MLLLDFSSVIIANLHAQVGIHNMKVVEEDLLRHMILNTIRAIRVKFREHELVIACDHGSWRKSAFPYYKANRAKAKEATGLDWKKVFEIFGRMRSDLRDYFPYRVVEVEGAEADDVIGTLVREYGGDCDLPLAMSGEEVIIVSPDKDFAQLHRYTNVKQWDPIKKAFITHNDPDLYLLEHVIKGDSGDGIPNILSDDDTFVVEGKRQKPMTAKRLEEFKLKFLFERIDAIPLDEPDGRNFVRNYKLIDLRNTPSSLSEEILDVYDQQAGKDRSQIFNYMMKNKLRNLMETINEF